jgi:two-component system sensor histidine kinase KdpD
VRVVAALVLVIPVVLTAVFRGRTAAYVVAVLSAAVLSLLSEPVGSFRVHVAEELIALIVFTGVAFVVSTLVAGRIELLGRVERQRAALLRAVSHDLRTPLAVIEAAASDLRDGTHDAAERDELLTVITDESHRLDRLVANLLSLSRIDAGALVPNRQELDVEELVVEVVRRLDRAVVERDVRVDVEPGLGLLADYALLDQVVTNLVENAARHGRTIDVRARRDGGAVELVVADDGPGVPVSDRDAIFLPFGAGGTGLAICKAVVEAHAGTIAVGDRPGGGASFTVRLPAE